MARLVCSMPSQVPEIVFLNSKTQFIIEPVHTYFAWLCACVRACVRACARVRALGVRRYVLLCVSKYVYMSTYANTLTGPRIQ